MTLKSNIHGELYKMKPAVSGNTPPADVLRLPLPPGETT